MLKIAGKPVRVLAGMLNSKKLVGLLQYGGDIYSFPLKLIKNRYNSPKNKVLKDRIDKIFFDYVLAENTSKKAIILLPGLPEYPCHKSLLRRFSALGVDAYLPRYEGTFESDGDFLSKNLADSIKNFILSIKEQKEYKKIFILSTSFGGAVSLSLPQEVFTKSVHLSPVVKFSEIKPILTGLDGYLKKNFKYLYRFDDEAWELLLKDKILYPLKNKKNLSPTKNLILLGDKDTAINTPVKEYYKGFKVKTFKNIKHINFTSVLDSNLLFNEVCSFLFS